MFVGVDVREESEFGRLIEATISGYGRLDMAYNNGGAETSELVDQTAADFDLTFGTNVRGLFVCLKHELRHMIRQGSGTVVNAASAGSVRPVPHIWAADTSRRRWLDQPRLASKGSVALVFVGHRAEWRG